MYLEQARFSPSGHCKLAEPLGQNPQLLSGGPLLKALSPGLSNLFLTSVLPPQGSEWLPTGIHPGTLHSSLGSLTAPCPALQFLYKLPSTQWECTFLFLPGSKTSEPGLIGQWKSRGQNGGVGTCQSFGSILGCTHCTAGLATQLVCPDLLFFLSFLGLQPQHMEVPRLGVQLEL